MEHTEIKDEDYAPPSQENPESIDGQGIEDGAV